MAHTPKIDIGKLINYLQICSSNQPVNLYQITKHFQPNANSRYDLDFVIAQYNVMFDLTELTQGALKLSLFVGTINELPTQMPKLKLYDQPNQDKIWFGPYVYHSLDQYNRGLTQKETKKTTKLNNQEYLKLLQEWLIQSNQKHS